MDDLLSKLTTYNIFNYLLPGTIFAFTCNYLNIFSFHTDSVVIELFLYYFIGMTVSRVGSVIVEPIFKKLSIVEYAPYEDYLKAAPTDSKIELLLEANNTYRTIAALFLCILLAAGILSIAASLSIPDRVIGLVTTMLMTILYVIAYRKQTAYIRRRIEHQVRK